MVVLQETRLFHSSFNSKARTMAILIHKRVHFTISEFMVDKNGRYLIIVGRLFNNPVLLVNIYATNFDSPDFTDRLFRSLPFLDSHLAVLGGDFNCVMSPSVERSSARSLTHSPMSKSVSEFKNG